MRRLALAFVLTLAACATPAAVAPPPTTVTAPANSPLPAQLPSAEGVSFDLSTAPAGSYVLDPRHTSLIWRVRHQGMSLYTGRFDGCLHDAGGNCPDPGVTSTLTFNPQAPEQSTLTATVHTAAVNTGLVNQQGERYFDHSIQGYLGTAQFPDAVFTARSLQKTGATTGLMTGDLAFHGQTHPITFEVSFQGGRSVLLRGGKYVLAFQGRTVFSRSQFGISNLIINQFLSDEVEVIFNGEFVHQ